MHPLAFDGLGSGHARECTPIWRTFQVTPGQAPHPHLECRRSTFSACAPTLPSPMLRTGRDERRAGMTDLDLQAAIAPRSVAVIGASTNPNKIGGRPIAFMGKFGYRGTIYPINPNSPEVQGHKSFPDLASL